MATIGSLWINVKSNTSGLSKGLGKAKGMLGKFGKFAASPAGCCGVRCVDSRNYANCESTWFSSQRVYEV